jgi:predicted metal-dependent hydrolase
VAMDSERDWFEAGIELFNAGRFFECHEAWEEVWKRADGDARRFYQGLIQFAVAILHAQRGNREGAKSVYAKACRNLAQLPDEYMGVALGRLRRDLAGFMDAQSGGEASRPKPPPPQLMRSRAARR